MSRSEGERVRFGGRVLAGAIAVLMVNLDTTVVTIILPDLARIFHETADTVSLVNVFYLFTLTVFLPVFGKLSDRIGVERVFTPGYILFSICSLICGLAPWVEVLFVARLFQGVAGAMLMATSAVIVVKYIPAGKRGTVFGINGLMAGIGFALGAPMGGWLSSLLSWRWVFFLNVPLGVAGFFLCATFLNDREKPGGIAGFDLPGSLLAIFGLGCAVMTLSTARLFNLPALRLLAGICTVFFFFLFVRREKKADDPLLNLSLLADRRLSSSLLANFTYLFFLYGLTFILPFFFRYVRGESTIATSHYLAVFPLVSMVFMPLIGRICDRIGTRIPALTGMVLFTAAAILISFFTADSSVGTIIFALGLLGIGMGLFCTSILTMTMTHATPENTGMISGLKAFFPIFGGLLGTTLFASVFSHWVESAGMAVEQAPPLLIATGFSHSMHLAIGAAVTGLLFTLLSGPKQ